MNGMVCSTTVEILRYSETPCSMINLFDTGVSNKMQELSLLVQKT